MCCISYCICRKEVLKIWISHLLVFSSLQRFTGKLHILCHESHQSSVAGSEIHKLCEINNKCVIEMYSTQSMKFLSYQSWIIGLPPAVWRQSSSASSVSSEGIWVGSRPSLWRSSAGVHNPKTKFKLLFLSLIQQFLLLITSWSLANKVGMGVTPITHFKYQRNHENM